MRHLTVKTTGVLSSGKWVVLHDPHREERWGEADLVSNSIPGEGRLLRLRGPTDLQLFDKLCLATGKPAGQMPSLEHFYIGFGGGESDWSKWADTELSYEIRRPRHEEPSLEIRAVPMLGSSEETIKVWRETSAKHGVGFWMRSGSSDGALEEASRHVG
ncbi:hypothetical protein NCS52_01263700 [Fusarium sp. LHS14.1]|nr:hypothetical protein NCS52_01263700 [Fusarium sp. LHS14.1]